MLTLMLITLTCYVFITLIACNAILDEYLLCAREHFRQRAMQMAIQIYHLREFMV